MNRISVKLACALVLAATVVYTALPALADSAMTVMRGERVQGNGRVVAQVRQPGHFKGVEVSVPAQVEVRLGGSESVRIEGDDNIVPLVATAVENGVLVIRTVRKNVQLETRRLKILVQAREIENLGLAGAGTLVAKGIRSDKLTLEVAGSGSLDIADIDAKTVSVGVAGSGLVTATGRAQQAQVSVAGSGRADTTGLQAAQVTASIAGSGLADVAARQSLAANITGSGQVRYAGDAQVTKAVVGSGAVTRLQR